MKKIITAALFLIYNLSYSQSLPPDSVMIDTVQYKVYDILSDEFYNFINSRHDTLEINNGYIYITFRGKIKCVKIYEKDYRFQNDVR